MADRSVVKRLRRGMACLCQAWHRRLALRNLRRLEERLTAAETRLAVPFLFRGPGLFRRISPMQSQYEIGRLYQSVLALRPKRVIEIGTCHGGTLYLWCQAADAAATVLSIDLPEGEFGGGYHSSRTAFYSQFAREHQTLRLLRADSHAAQTVESVSALLGQRQADFLFIDGDHTYAGVKRDFELYSPLVAGDGLIALHDIARREDEPRIEVWRFWQELKAQPWRTEEILDTSPAGRTIGIGLVRRPSAS